MSDKKTYALSVLGVRNKQNEWLSASPMWFWVIDEPEGWVGASSYLRDDEVGIPKDVKVFSTKDEAEAFAKRWKGHPWWCEPSGKFEIVELKPLMETKRIGWQRKTATAETYSRNDHPDPTMAHLPTVDGKLIPIHPSNVVEVRHTTCLHDGMTMVKTDLPGTSLRYIGCRVPILDVIMEIARAMNEANAV